MEKVNDRVDTVNERMNPTRIVRRRTATVRTGIRNVRESVMGAADDAKMAPEVVRGQAQGNPLRAGLVAFGGGLVLATALPPTDNERQASERIVDGLEPLKEQAVSAGRSMAGELQQSAQGASTRVRKQARRSTGTVKSQAGSSSGRTAKRSARSS